MKALGIVRNIDPLGRVVIPRETRRILGIEVGDAVEMFVDGEDVIIRKYNKSCTFCNESNLKNLVEIDKKCVCKACVLKLQKEIN